MPSAPDMIKSMTSACRHIKRHIKTNKLCLPPPAALLLLPVHSSHLHFFMSHPQLNPLQFVLSPHLSTESAMDQSKGACSTPFLFVFSEALDSLDNCLLP